MDANDAKVISPGTLEFELQPVGYYQVLSEELGHYLVAPSLMGYVGITEDADFIYLTRGFALLDDDPEQVRYRTWENQIAFRFLVVRGRYSTEGAEGPSLVVQPALMVPNFDAEGEIPGFSLAILLAQQWDAGTLHANVWATRTTWQSFELFLAAAMEGPPDWDVRPLVEVTYVYDTEYGHVLSGTAGSYFDIGDDFTWELGARLGGWEEYAEVEVRVSMWIDAPLAPPSWHPEEASDDDGDGASEPAGDEVAAEASGAQRGER